MSKPFTVHLKRLYFGFLDWIFLDVLNLMKCCKIHDRWCMTGYSYVSLCCLVIMYCLINGNESFNVVWNANTDGILPHVFLSTWNEKPHLNQTHAHLLHGGGYNGYNGMESHT